MASRFAKSLSWQKVNAVLMISCFSLTCSLNRSPGALAGSLGVTVTLSMQDFRIVSVAEQARAAPQIAQLVDRFDGPVVGFLFPSRPDFAFEHRFFAAGRGLQFHRVPFAGSHLNLTDFEKPRCSICAVHVRNCTSWLAPIKSSV